MRPRAGFSPHSGRTHTGSAFFYADDRLPGGFPIFGKAFREREILLRVGLAREGAGLATMNPIRASILLRVLQLSTPVRHPPRKLLTRITDLASEFVSFNWPNKIISSHVVFQAVRGHVPDLLPFAAHQIEPQIAHPPSRTKGVKSRKAPRSEKGREVIRCSR